MTILDEILKTKLDEVTLLRQPQTRDLLRGRALDAPPARDFAGALRSADGNVAVIGEIKRRSPSKGELAPDLDASTTAKAYETGGARALSVLTDGPYFGGLVADLQAASEATSLPILRKDFTIDEVQIYEARAIGSDAILLICSAISDDGLLADLQGLALDLGMSVLVEAHDWAEVLRAVEIGARVIGVNSRDLATFNEDLAGARALADAIPSDRVAVAESSIRSPADARAMASAGFDAVLVGEALVRAADPIGLLRELASGPVTRRS